MPYIRRNYAGDHAELESVQGATIRLNYPFILYSQVKDK